MEKKIGLDELKAHATKAARSLSARVSLEEESRRKIEKIRERNREKRKKGS